MSKQKSKGPAYGGQAVIEGVMFGGPHVNVTAIRRTDESIDYLEVIRPKEKGWLKGIKQIPLLRGIVAIILSAARGAKHLNFASERYEVEPEKDGEIVPAEQSSKLTMVLGVALLGVLSFALGKVIFTALPAFLASFFDRWIVLDSTAWTYILRNLVEGVIKSLLLLTYIWLIARTPLVKRLFQYHGAEHKVINTFEAGKALTVNNVRSHSRLHYRCGSSFMIFTVIVGVIVYSFFHYETTMERILDRIVLLPLVIGLSYEILRFTNAVRDVPGFRFLGYPGLWLQRLTTREPDDKQIEVSIASFQRMLELETEIQRQKSPGEVSQAGAF